MAKNVTTGVIFEFDYFDLPVILIGVLGVISNTLLLVAFRKDPLKCFRNSATYLVMNLSVCDGLTCLFAPFFHVFILNSSAYYYLQYRFMNFLFTGLGLLQWYR